jgi:hypothetical protein
MLILNLAQGFMLDKLSIKTSLKVTNYGTLYKNISIKMNCCWKENLKRRSRTKISRERGKN